MVDVLAETFLGIPLFLWGIGCLVVAVIFAIAWPRKNVIRTEGGRYLVVRWGHSLVWVLLGASCFIRALGGVGLADIVGFLALPTYLTFMVTLFSGSGTP